ncbi:MAG: N-acetylmuramoyl-L-alanine amidase, partial [Lentisphaeria bacterium]|nr:N-acetylmuramoyl-L-alanine amidase [Lentisphaeria bacterium]
MTNRLRFSCLLTACLIVSAANSYAQTVTDVPLPNVSAQVKEAATAIQNTVSAAEAGKLPTAEEIAAERARLEKMKAQLAAERAALEKYRADLVRRQQEAAEAAAKAQAEAAAKAQAEAAAGTTTANPPPAKADPVASKPLTAEEIQKQRQLAIERAQAIQKAIAAQKAADAKKKAAAAAQTSVPPDKDVATMKLRRITQDKVRYVHLRDVAVNYGLTFAYTKKNDKISGAVLHDKTRKAVISATYREGTVNGVQVHFLYPMILKKSDPYISEVDFLTVFDPLMRSKTAVKLGMKTIMIDAGHGGSDPGAMNGNHKEKVYTLQIAKRLQTQLEKLGFRVIMTRTGDTYPTLQDRAALCRKYKPDLYISIHCNSSTNKTPAGIETYRAVPVGGTETKGSKVKTEKQSANEFDANSSRLAYEIQKGMVAATGGIDRGTRHQAIYVIGNASCP